MKARWIFGSLLLTISCGQPADFNLTDQIETFRQHIVYNNRVDILWVIDNSNSMTIHQDHLAQQYQHFVRALVETEFDFHLAVTSTDMSPSGEGGKFVGEPNVLASTHADLDNKFRDRVRLGNQGFSVEKGLDAMAMALSDEYLQSYNRGFLRDDSMLVVIFLSDEDDKSSSEPQFYIDRLNTLRPVLPDGSKNWMTHFIGVLDENSECKDNFGQVNPGYRYMQVVGASDGLNENICTSDLRVALKNLRSRIVEIMTEYKLEREPIVETIRVQIDGQLVPQDEENGWTYFAENISIRFHGTAVPKNNSEIRVDYAPLHLR